MIVHFPAYRNFTAVRRMANDGMMALLIGKRLGSAELEKNEDKSILLPKIYKDLEGIKKLNRSVDDAIKILEESEKDFAYMAIPYALAIYSTLLIEIAQILRDNHLEPYEIEPINDLTKLPLEIAHEYIADCCHESFDEVYLPLFHVARRLRNRIIHRGGAPSSNIDYQDLDSKAKKIWVAAAKRPLSDAMPHDQLLLRDSEVIAVLAVCRRLAAQANSMVARAVDSKLYWAAIVTCDYLHEYPQKIKQPERLIKHLRGYAKVRYQPLQLSDEELQLALDKELGT